MLAIASKIAVHVKLPIATYMAPLQGIILGLIGDKLRSFTIKKIGNFKAFYRLWRLVFHRSLA